MQWLLQAPFDQAWQSSVPAAPAPAARLRLLARAAGTLPREAELVTRRRRGSLRTAVAPGATAQTLYLQPASRPGRPGEPHRVRLLELAPGTALQPQDWCSQAAQQHHRELLVLQGEVEVDGLVLSLRDFHLLPAGAPTPALHSAQGALLFVREAQVSDSPGATPLTVRDALAGWPDFAPGIQRRVLWQHAGQASMLYLAQPGALVPLHQHGHDEECLMVQGELFLDDLLLQPGDYQLAPAGSAHRSTETDTGAVIYAHGDLDLQFVG